MRGVRSALMIAVAIMLAVACGERRERENAAAVQHDLAEMRKAIHDYRRDKGHPPATLDELVRSHDLLRIPNDPITGKADWRLIVEVPVQIDEFQTSAPAPAAAGGIVDIRSAAPGTDSNGRAWSEY